jgi:hypothetical protein
MAGHQPATLPTIGRKGVMNRFIPFIPPLLIVSICGCEPKKGPDSLKGVQNPAKTSELPIDDQLTTGKKYPPERPPELFGIVERVEKRTIGNSKEFEAVLVKGHPPLIGRLKPSSPLFIDGQPQLLWLNTPLTTVERRNGPIAVGQYVLAWYNGEVFATDPGQVYPEYIISEGVIPK